MVNEHKRSANIWFPDALTGFPDTVTLHPLLLVVKVPHQEDGRAEKKDDTNNVERLIKATRNQPPGLKSQSVEAWGCGTNVVGNGTLTPMAYLLRACSTVLYVDLFPIGEDRHGLGNPIFCNRGGGARRVERLRLVGQTLHLLVRTTSLACARGGSRDMAAICEGNLGYIGPSRERCPGPKSRCLSRDDANVALHVLHRSSKRFFTKP